jgi:hypothetical protein
MTDHVSHLPRLSRRLLLAGAASTIGGAALGLGVVTPGPVVASPVPEWRGRRSANGWPIVDEVPQHAVEGSDVTVRLLAGDVATVLLHIVRRFSYEVDELEPTAANEPSELVGHTAVGSVAADFESNHFSGTAVGIRPTLYPIRANGGFFPHDLVVIRDVLADCEGVVRWGGDMDPVKESHFQIDVRPGNAGLARVASKIRGWEASPDAGAGATDPLAPGRRNAARALERIQAG